MALQIPPGEIVETADHRVFMWGISWNHYELLLEMRTGRRMPRMAYLDGALEFMTTSEDHERLTQWISGLAMEFMRAAGIDYGAYGSYTIKSELKKAGAEADQCFRIGLDQTKGRSPDLAIEVIWTHGGIDKLEIYRRFGVGEVWFWKDGDIEVYVLREGNYEAREHSAVVPGIDFAELLSFLDEPLLSEAQNKYRDVLRAKRS